MGIMKADGQDRRSGDTLSPRPSRTAGVDAVAKDMARAAGEQRSDITAGRGYRFPLPPHPIAAEQARILVRLALAEWNMPSVADNASIVVAELVSNAVKIGDVFRLTLSCQDSNVLIEVTDNSEASPERQQRSTDRVDGRGLLLVEGCAKDWGWRLEEAGGKTIWALVGDLTPNPDACSTTPPPAVRM